MGKRIGANGRKKKAERRGKRPQGVMRFLSIGILYAALFIAGTALLVRYKENLPGMVGIADRFKRTTVTSVVMQGAVHVAPEEIMRRSGIKLPVTLDLLKREYLYVLSKTSPWIEKVHLMTARQGTVTLGVVERKPVAMVRMQTAAKIALVDTEGVCFPLDPHAVLVLPLISGLTDSVGACGIHRLTAGDCSRMNRFLCGAVRLDSSFARRITQVHFTPLRTVHIMLSGSMTAITLDENDAVERLQRLMQVWETLEYDSLPPSRINLTCRNLAFVTMGTAVPGGRHTTKGPAGKRNKG